MLRGACTVVSVRQRRWGRMLRGARAMAGTWAARDRGPERHCLHANRHHIAARGGLPRVLRATPPERPGTRTYPS